MPLIVLIRNRLKYALTKREVTSIMMQRTVQVDGKVRTDPNYPTGFMDVVSIEKTGEHFRIMYDVKGRFLLHRISPEESAYKLCKVKKYAIGARSIPYIVTHDGRTIRYPHPSVRANDTIRFNLATNTIEEVAKFETGNMALITAGHSMGRIGTIVHRERHPGGFEIVHLKDARDQTFATRISNVFVIGAGSQEWVSLPKAKGIKLSIAEERDARLAARK
jgi:small subunit ribosomal protein S4e